MHMLRRSSSLPQSLRTRLLSLTRAPAFPVALLLLALSSALVFGNQRDSFYFRGHNTHITSQSLMLASNMSPERNFLMFMRQTLDEDGEVAYEPYNRFPIGTYLLIKPAILPFEGDFSAQILAARLLTLALFVVGGLLAYLSLCRLTPSRWIALAATLLTFSSYYWLYYNDMVSSEITGAIGVMLAFHGLVVFAQEGRFRQLVVKACVALLLGWYVYALLLPFIVIGLAGELVGALRAHRSLSPISQAGRAALTLLRSRYLALGVATLLFGLLMLGLNFGSEYYALKGETPLTELPSFQSMLNRSGQSEEFNSQYAESVAWQNYLPDQIYRIGGMMIPYGVPGYGATGLGWTAGESPAPGVGIALGLAACAACAVGLAFARHKHLFAAIVLAGFVWIIPMRHVSAFHQFESILYTGIPLFLFALALLGARRLLGERAVGAAAAVAAALFAVSAFQMADVGNDFGLDEVYEEMMADFEIIRPLAEGKTVFAPQYPDKWMFSGAYRATHYYLTGSVILFIPESDRRALADLVITRERKPGAALLTPDNRQMFLYDRAAYDAQRLAELRESAADDMRVGIAARENFDLYLRDGRLIYAKEDCGSDDAARRFFLHITPRNVADLPAERRLAGFDNMDFWFWEYGASSDGECLAIAPLPEYEIDSIRTGQFVVGEGSVWSAIVSVDRMRYLSEMVDRMEQTLPVRADFDLYWRDNRLMYAKEDCGRDDTARRFFLHITPRNVNDLPPERRRHGIDNRDFWFEEYGAGSSRKCFAIAPLPEYEIDSIRTGQFDAAGGTIWSAVVNEERLRYLRGFVDVYEAIAAGAYGVPVIESDFRIYRRDNALVYHKPECAIGDTDPKFLLHIIPQDAADLPSDRRESGFDNLDFRFGDYGASLVGGCVAVVPLPEYAIDSIRTGQFGDEGAVWRVEFDAR